MLGPLSALFAIALTMAFLQSPRRLDPLDQIRRHPYPVRALALFGALLFVFYLCDLFIRRILGNVADHAPFRAGDLRPPSRTRILRAYPKTGYL